MGTDRTGEPDVVVLRAGTEGLSTAAYAERLRERLPDHDVAHARTPQEERELVPRARVVTGNDLDGDLLDAAERLSLFACTYAGTDHLPMAAFAERDVVVTNASGIHAPGIAEQAIGSMLVFARRLHEGWRRKRNREWRHYQSFEFARSTVTVVGLGAIGTAVIDRLAGFGVDTIGIRNSPEKGGPTDEVYGYDDGAVHDALSRSGYIVLAAPLTDTTAGLIDAAAFETMPPEAVLVNVARGGIVDTAALVDALRSNRIRGAALDVTDPEPLPEDHPLWTLENCLVTPHVGGHTPRHWDRLADIVAHNVTALDEGGTLRNVVDG
jgi:phosphoglycerate dehydrogenase-like enzyme